MKCTFIIDGKQCPEDAESDGNFCLEHSTIVQPKLTSAFAQSASKSDDQLATLIQDLKDGDDLIDMDELIALLGGCLQMLLTKINSKEEGGLEKYYKEIRGTCRDLATFLEKRDVLLEKSRSVISIDMLDRLARNYARVLVKYIDDPAVRKSAVEEIHQQSLYFVQTGKMKAVETRS